MAKNKIIIVDDTRIHRLIMYSAVKGMGYDIIQLESGEQLLELLETGVQGLILLDNTMEGMSGVNCLKEIRKKWDRVHLPVIMVTASDDAASLLAALSAGANDFITKPYINEVVKARVSIQLEINQIMIDNLKLKELQTITNMIATYNHEINNPLTGAIGFLKRARAKNDSPHLHTVGQLLQRVAEIVAKIKDLSRGELTSENYQNDIKIYKV